MAPHDKDDKTVKSGELRPVDRGPTSAVEKSRCIYNECVLIASDEREDAKSRYLKEEVKPEGDGDIS